MRLQATMDPDGVRRLLWRGLDCGDKAYHAALFAVDAIAPSRISAHRHDFFEMMYILDGAGEHPIRTAKAGSRKDWLHTGDLVFLRPDDCHALTVPAGGRLHWINIAFPADSWRAFRAAAALEAEEWDDAPFPQVTSLARPERRAVCAALFEEKLRRFQHGRVAGALTPDGLDLCHFLVEAVLLMRPDAEEEPAAVEGPPWLRHACRIMEHSPANAVVGVDRLVALAGVSYAHLARSLKAATGKTPTQYVNHLRLARAALLLTTTAHPIVDIAGECGFDQLSYFYRLFRRRFGASPDAYRRAARLPLAP